MIEIRNIYYMLSYAFQILREQNYRQLATEDFDNAAELCAAILTKGISAQLKRGLGREYLRQTEPLSTLRGKPDITASIKQQTLLRRQLVCSYDSFSINTELNGIIKSTVLLLIRADISASAKKTLRDLMVYFAEVDEIDLRRVRWSRSFDRTNRTYELLISICHLVYLGLLQSPEPGKQRLRDFIDEQRMCRLYERFILEYYRREHPYLHAAASQIAWQLDDDVSDMLPRMQSDITLSRGDTVLIIDAKYYSHVTQHRYGAHTLHSANLYQIFTYVKNKEYELRDRPHTVSGLLLYAGTDDAVLPDNRYRMSGNTIGASTLDLSGDFARIRTRLDAIASEFFPQRG